MTTLFNPFVRSIDLQSIRVERTFSGEPIAVIDAFVDGDVVIFDKQNGSRVQILLAGSHPLRIPRKSSTKLALALYVVDRREKEFEMKVELSVPNAAEKSYVGASLRVKALNPRFHVERGILPIAKLRQRVQELLNRYTTMYQLNEFAQAELVCQAAIMQLDCADVALQIVSASVKYMLAEEVQQRLEDRRRRQTDRFGSGPLPPPPPPRASETSTPELEMTKEEAFDHGAAEADEARGGASTPSAAKKKAEKPDPAVTYLTDETTHDSALVTPAPARPIDKADGLDVVAPQSDVRPLPRPSAPPAPAAPSPAPAVKPTPTTPAAALDEVRFTAFHPKILYADTWYTLLVYAHIEEALRKVRQDADKFEAEMGDAAHESHSKNAVKIQRGTTLTIVPSCDQIGVTFNPPQIDLNWTEDMHRAAFRFKAELYLSDVAVNLLVSIFIGPVCIATIKSGMLVEESQKSMRARINTDTLSYTSARVYRADQIFISYSHADTSVVEACRKAYQALGYDVLIDWATLRAGEKWNTDLLSMIDNAEIFQLFWSPNSAASAYVRQEWERALERAKAQKLVGFIRPVYWEKPLVQPPSQLADLHFAYVPLDPADQATDNVH